MTEQLTLEEMIKLAGKVSESTWYLDAHTNSAVGILEQLSSGPLTVSVRLEWNTQDDYSIIVSSGDNRWSLRVYSEERRLGEAYHAPSLAPIYQLALSRARENKTKENLEIENKTKRQISEVRKSEL